MDEATMRDRVTQARVARLATVSDDGRPHVVPCCFVLHGDELVSAVDGKPKSTARLQRIRNLEANPAAAFVVDHYDDDWTRLWWVRLDTTGRLLAPGPEHDATLVRLAAKYEQYRRDPPPGPVLAFTVDRWTAWP